MSMIGCLRFTTESEIERLIDQPESIHDFLADEPSGTHLVGDVDKAWHGIHFLLTGTAWEGSGPAAFLVTGGREVGDEDVGYGPARAFGSAETKAVSAALDELPAEALRTKFDVKRMTELDIYPTIIWERDGDKALDYLIDHYEGLRQMLRSAAADGLGMIVYCC
jgi:hypothetical protein